MARASTAACYHRDTQLSRVTVVDNFAPKFTIVKSENWEEKVL
jgi:hypothetical protein